MWETSESVVSGVIATHFLVRERLIDPPACPMKDADIRKASAELLFSGKYLCVYSKVFLNCPDTRSVMGRDL